VPFPILIGTTLTTVLHYRGGAPLTVCVCVCLCVCVASTASSSESSDENGKHGVLVPAAHLKWVK